MQRDAPTAGSSPPSIIECLSKGLARGSCYSCWLHVMSHLMSSLVQYRPQQPRSPRTSCSRVAAMHLPAFPSTYLPVCPPLSAALLVGPCLGHGKPPKLSTFVCNWSMFLRGGDQPSSHAPVPPSPPAHTSHLAGYRLRRQLACGGRSRAAWWRKPTRCVGRCVRALLCWQAGGWAPHPVWLLALAVGQGQHAAGASSVHVDMAVDPT
jgi:hypothetical protein